MADAVAWGNKLKADPRLGRLIVLGHSEGALIASLAAPQLDAAGVISIAGTARPVDQVLRQQLSYRLPGIDGAGQRTARQHQVRQGR